MTDILGHGQAPLCTEHHGQSLDQLKTRFKAPNDLKGRQVWVWHCCNCAYSNAPIISQMCPACGHERCAFCATERIKIKVSRPWPGIPSVNSLTTRPRLTKENAEARFTCNLGSRNPAHGALPLTAFSDDISPDLGASYQGPQDHNVRYQASFMTRYHLVTHSVPVALKALLNRSVRIPSKRATAEQRCWREYNRAQQMAYYYDSTPFKYRGGPVLLDTEDGACTIFASDLSRQKNDRRHMIKVPYDMSRFVPEFLRCHVASIATIPLNLVLCLGQIGSVNIP